MTGPLRPRVRAIPLTRVFPEAYGADPTATAAVLPDPAIGGITLDSRSVLPGDVYVALPGHAHHGAQFAADAVRAGARAVLTDPAGHQAAVATGVPVVVLPDPRARMAAAAADIYGRPTTKLTTYALTGTNGKTTTAFLLAAALAAAGRRAGVVGTLGFFLDGEPLVSARTTVTTPESPDLQALLAVLVERGADSVVMEVSSHALVLGRADAIVFDVAGFTNLGRDHLDFHGDEDSYFAAKASLFTAARTRQAAITVDDSRGRELADRVRAAGEIPAVTVSVGSTGAGYRAERVAPSPAGTAVLAQLAGRSLRFDLALPGEFNVRNALLALACLDLTGVDVQHAATGLAAASVPGRMQRVDLGPNAPRVYVDFAHTPQAVTAALRAVNAARTVVVLGCGGDRDPDKRGPMGAAAARDADIVLITDDNPRSEDPAAIRDEVFAGATAIADRRAVEVADAGDRRHAIRLALSRSGPTDVVAILGKGHEQGQEVSGSVHPFSDLDVVVEEWRAVSLADRRRH